jgi:hypothetical protein
VADERRFIGAIHPSHMESDLRAAGLRQVLPRRGHQPSRRPSA